MAAPAALALHFDVGVEFFVAMKQIMFGKYPQNTLQEYFLDQWQHTHPQPSIEIEPFVEPDHPEWFDDCIPQRPGSFIGGADVRKSRQNLSASPWGASISMT